MPVRSRLFDKAQALTLKKIQGLLLLMLFSGLALSNQYPMSINRGVVASGLTPQAKSIQKPHRKTAPPLLKSDRQSLTVREALMGHWVNEEGNIHYFYSKEKLISVFPGSVNHIPYKIVAVNEKARQIRIRITKVHFEIYTFSPDNHERSDIGEIGGMRSEQPFVYKYVDDKRQPSAELLKSIAGEKFKITTLDVPPDFIIGDNKTKFFYRSGCPEYETLPLAQRVYFKTKSDAQRAGFRAAKSCP